MAARACLTLCACALVATGARAECLPNKVVSDAAFNRTILTVISKADIVNRSEINTQYDIVGLWDRFPKVIVPRSRDEGCRRDGELYLRSLAKLEMWALKMFDATAKLPSGILSGNINQYGDFDECLSVRGDVRAQYCLASVQLQLDGEPALRQIDHLLHGRHYIRSNLTDMGHRVPRFSSIMWGVCMPSSCSSSDLEEELTKLLDGMDVQVRVDSSMCTTGDIKTRFSLGKTLSIAFFLVITLLLVLGTILDFGGEGTTTSERVLNAFSLRRNWQRLLDTSDGAGQVCGVEGVRSLNALALLLAHKSMALAHNPFINKSRLGEVFGMPWAVIGRTAIIYTDSFLYLSGLLNAYNLFREMDKKGSIDFKARLIARWFRLFPLLLSLILFCTYILPDSNSGPQWNLVVREHGRVCERSMWRSFLFIHNFFGFEEMCLTHTHQIGLDMQLYAATLPLAWLLWRRPRLGWALALAVALASTLLRYLAVYAHNINMVVFYGISVQQLLDTAKYSYILPTHRATIYLIGVAMAAVILSKRSKFVLSKMQAFALWCCALALALWPMIGPWRMGLPTYQYQPGPAALYSALSPLLWGSFLAVAHWAVINGYGGWFTEFLSSRPFKLFNKIAYSVYLTQFPIYFYNVGVQRHSDFYSPFAIFYLPEILVILGISVLTTITIEMPFNELHKVFFGKQSHKSKIQ